MPDVLAFLLYLIAFVCFVLAAVGVTSRVNLVAPSDVWRPALLLTSVRWDSEQEGMASVAGVLPELCSLR